METERIALSQRERDRLKVLHEVEQKQLTQRAAAERLKVSDRQVRRMPTLCDFLFRKGCGFRSSTYKTLRRNRFRLKLDSILNGRSSRRPEICFQSCRYKPIDFRSSFACCSASFVACLAFASGFS